jgi:hypothetical protein
MASKSSSNSSTEKAEVDSQDAEQTPPPEEQQAPAEPIEQQENINAEQQEGETEPAPEDEEGSHYSLPPTLAEAGGVGIVGTVSGMFTVSNGSYLLSPGQPLMMSAEDAQTLVDQGVAVMLDQYKTS